MVHGIFHVMSDIKEGRFCWIINLATKTHVKVLNTIASLNSDMH